MGEILETIVQQNAKKYHDTIKGAINYVSSLTYSELDEQSNAPLHLRLSEPQENEPSEEVVLDLGEFDVEQLYAPTGEYQDILFKKKRDDEQEYRPEKAAVSSDTESEAMTTNEAGETVVEFQYAVVTGAFHDISYVRRRRLALWADFNRTELNLFHRLNGLTSEVNYSKVM